MIKTLINYLKDIARFVVGIWLVMSLFIVIMLIAMVPLFGFAWILDRILS